MGETHVSQGRMDRLAYSRDQWPRCLLRLKRGLADFPPDLVVWPGDAEEVAEVLRRCCEAEVPVVVVTAGSAVTGAAAPTQGGVVMDLKRLDRVRRVSRESGVAEVEAGVLGIHLEEELQRHGATLGHYPSSVICSAVGGWVGGRSAGQCSSKYGKIEDMVVDLELALPDGRLVRSSGPFDLAPLVVGSEGTAAVVCAATLKVRPNPVDRAFRGVLMPDVERGLEAIRAMLQEEGVRPSVIRLYDEIDTVIAVKGEHPEDSGLGRSQALAPRSDGLLERLTAPARRLAGVALAGALGIPGVAAMATETLLPSECLLILVSETEVAGAAEQEMKAALAPCLRLGGKDLGQEPGRHWFDTRYKISFKQTASYEMGVFVDTMEVAARWSKLKELYRNVRDAISRHALVMAHFSHAYPDGCSIYFSFAAPFQDDAEARYDRIWRDGLRAAHDAGGSISHHHGIGVNKAPEMPLEFGDTGMELISAMREAFDPKLCMNPGKLGLPYGGRVAAAGGGRVG